MKGRIGLALLLVAAVAAVASGLYLFRAKKTLERTVTPVVVAAPDLYPADTLLFAAVHHVDESWNAVEAWWKRFEPTATCHLLEKKWKETRARKGLPPQVEEALADFEKLMDEAEARFGRRPNSREFFETYGKYTAFGLLPAKDQGRPRMLAVVKLPGEAAVAALRERLGGVAKVKRHDPPEIRGYPVFVEEGGPTGRVLYGVGGGYLFVADDAAVLGDSLGRLAAAAAGEKPGTGPGAAPVLSGDAVFRRGVPGDWEQVGVALFVRKDQQFARWDERLKMLDDYVRHAFVLAPSDSAVSLAAIRVGGAKDYAVRASFVPDPGAEKPWEEFLPTGCCMAWISAPPKDGPPREALLAGLEAFRRKEIWKEADALVRDTPRLKNLLQEALGAEGVPEDEVLRRLPKDAEFVAANFREATESALLSPTASFAFGQKVYDGEDTRVETVFAVAIDPMASLLVAGLFDLFADRKEDLAPGIPNPFERAGEAGVQAWRFRLGRMMEGLLGDMREEDRSMLLRVMKQFEPSVIVSGGRAWITLGEEMFGEVRGLAAGRGKTLATDALFQEASAAISPGAAGRYFSRPGEVARGSIGGILGLVGRALESKDAPRELRDLFRAVTAAFDEVVLWQRSVRVSMAATYADPSRPAESVSLMDPVEEKAHPQLEMDPAALAAPEALPAGVCVLAEGRIDVRPAADAFTAAFLKGLPGGRERWDELRAKVELSPEDLERRLEALLVDMRGEAGFAIAAPAVADVETVAGTQDLLDRIPAFVLFAGYAHPEAAFETAAGLFEALAEATKEETPFEARKRLYDRGGGSRPFGTAAVRTEMDGRPLAAFRLFWSEAPHGAVLAAGMAVVRRDDLLFFTTSLPVAVALASAEPGAPGTFGERMRQALPAGTLPAACSRLFVQREDGFADCFSLYARPLAPGLAGLTLRGVEGRPAPDRIAAHQEGWRKLALLLEDLFRTGHWSVGATVRDKDAFRTVVRRVPGAPAK